MLGINIIIAKDGSKFGANAYIGGWNVENRDIKWGESIRGRAA